MRIHRLALILALILSSPPFSSAASTTPIDTDDAGFEGIEPSGRDSIPFVIVTTRALRAEFATLARAHRVRGLDARVWTIESIRRHVPGRDDAERIRAWLADLHRSRGVRAVLLGGDASIVPMRRAKLSLSIPPPFDTIALPTDQYYACLDGSWNADGDADWGESSEDSVDMIPELMVGRAPVHDRGSARRFVARTIAALDACHEDETPASVLLAANRFALAGFDFAQLTEQLRPLFEPIATVTRLYQNAAAWPGALPESRAALIAELDRGPDLAVLYGTGDHGVFVAGDDLDPAQRFTAADAAGLDNRRKSIVLVHSAFTNEPGSPVSIGAALINAPHGGAVAVLGATDIQFVAIGNAFLTRILDEVYQDGVPTLGEAMRRALRSYTEPPLDAMRLSTQGMMLFGDPALPMSPPPSPTRAYRVPPRIAAVDLESITAFSPTTRARAATVRAAPSLSMAPAAPPEAALVLRARPRAPGSAPILLDLALPPGLAGTPYRLSLFDASGRRLRVLERGTVQAERRVVAWDARDAGGSAVPSGLYFVRLDVGRRSVASRVLVVH